MSTETTILVGVSVYLLAMIVIGVAVAKRSGTEEDFLVAGRKLPLWICVPTIMAIWFGGGTMLGAAGTGYEGGFLASISVPFGAALVLILMGFFFVRSLRRMKLLTVAQFIENRFGRVAGVAAAVALLLAIIGWIGGLMVGFGQIFQTMTGVPMELGILVGGVIVIGYTAIGGLWAVVLTDFVQVVIIAVGLLVLLVVVLIDVGGWSAIAPQLPEHTFRLIPLEHNVEIWLNYLRLWIIFGIADLTSQSLMQRVFAAKNEQTAQNAFYLAGAIEQVNLAMINMDKVVQQNAATSEQASAAANSLTGQARALTELVGRFELSEGSHTSNEGSRASGDHAYEPRLKAVGM